MNICKFKCIFNNDHKMTNHSKLYCSLRVFSNFLQNILNITKSRHLEVILCLLGTVVSRESACRRSCFAFSRCASSSRLLFLRLLNRINCHKMTQEGQITPPPVMWAQRSNLLFVTICLEDCKDPTVSIDLDKVYFKAIGGTEKKMHEVTINLYNEIDPDKTIQSPKGRNFELVLYKKESGPFWPRLTKENKKFHWLKSDFNKWQDEDESDDGGNFDLEQMMRQMGGLGGSVGDSKPNFDDLDMGDENDGLDSDDDEMPDLE